MPLYEYRCKSCSREFDLLRPWEFSDKSAECPSCGKPSMRKLSVIAGISGGADGPSSSGDAGPACGTSGDGCCGGGACSTMN